jgi:hypothetical protein
MAVPIYFQGQKIHYQVTHEVTPEKPTWLFKDPRSTYRFNFTVLDDQTGKVISKSKDHKFTISTPRWMQLMPTFGHQLLKKYKRGIIEFRRELFKAVVAHDFDHLASNTMGLDSLSEIMNSSFHQHLTNTTNIYPFDSDPEKSLYNLKEQVYSLKRAKNLANNFVPSPVAVAVPSVFPHSLKVIGIVTDEMKKTFTENNKDFIAQLSQQYQKLSTKLADLIASERPGAFTWVEDNAIVQQKINLHNRILKRVNQEMKAEIPKGKKFPDNFYEFNTGNYSKLDPLDRPYRFQHVFSGLVMSLIATRFQTISQETAFKKTFAEREARAALNANKVK